MLLLAVGAGAAVYWLTMRHGRVRRVETYVGGERLDEIDVGGEPATPGRDLRLTGVHFYHTIERLPGLRRLYAVARGPVLDLYEIDLVVFTQYQQSLNQVSQFSDIAGPIIITQSILGGNRRTGRTYTSRGDLRR